MKLYKLSLLGLFLIFLASCSNSSVPELSTTAADDLVACLNPSCTNSVPLDGAVIEQTSFGIRYKGSANKVEFEVDGQKHTESIEPFDAHETDDSDNSSIFETYSKGKHTASAKVNGGTTYRASFTVGKSTSSADLVACLNVTCTNSVVLDGATITQNSFGIRWTGEANKVDFVVDGVRSTERYVPLDAYGTNDTNNGSVFKEHADGAHTASAKINDGTTYTATFNVNGGGTTPPPADNCTHYVATNGSDSNNGESIAKPLKTLNKAVKALTAGKTLCIRGGTDKEALIHAIPGGTSWDAPVTLKAYSGETVTLKPQAGNAVLRFKNTSEKYIVIKGLILDAEISSTKGLLDVVKITGSASRIRIEDSTVRNAAGQGILATSGGNEFLRLKVYDNGLGERDHPQISHRLPNGKPNPFLYHGLYISSDNNLIERCEAYSNGGHGIQIYSRTNTSYSNVARNNKFHDNGYTGFILSSGADNIAYNNLIYNNGNNGISVIGGADKNKVYNNTVYGNENLGLSIIRDAENTVVKNNIIESNGRDIQDRGARTSSSNNLTSGAGMVNPARGDFRLSSNSQAAINKGASLTEVRTDFVGTARPQGGSWDIGAYEYR